MKSLKIDTQLVARLVEQQFPEWSHLPIRPVEKDGHDNRTFHLGDALGVRMPSAESYAAHVPIEHEWLPRLGPGLPLPITQIAGKGSPSEDYPLPWTINHWIPGETACKPEITDLDSFARDLGNFLVALQTQDCFGAPPPSKINFFRGGSLKTYEQQTLQYIQTLSGTIDQDAALQTWQAAVKAEWDRPAVWVHGDIAPGNLLIENGRLSAVIDFGLLAAGDPACDMAIAWTTFYGSSRQTFRETLKVDPDTWARARGWALWKALLLLAIADDPSSSQALEATHVINETTTDHEAQSNQSRE